MGIRIPSGTLPCSGRNPCLQPSQMVGVRLLLAVHPHLCTLPSWASLRKLTMALRAVKGHETVCLSPYGAMMHQSPFQPLVTVDCADNVPVDLILPTISIESLLDIPAPVNDTRRTVTVFFVVAAFHLFSVCRLCFNMGRVGDQGIFNLKDT